MKKWLTILLAVVLSVAMCACTFEEKETADGQEVTVVRTFQDGRDGEEHIWVTYYEMSDGTWKIGDQTYMHCIEVSGEMPGTSSVAKFTVLSNREDLTFSEVLSASGISSDLSDYFPAEEARIVRANYSITE